jgi:hypothetical protein
VPSCTDAEFSRRVALPQDGSPFLRGSPYLGPKRPSNVLLTEQEVGNESETRRGRDTPDSHKLAGRCCKPHEARTTCREKTLFCLTHFLVSKIPVYFPRKVDRKVSIDPFPATPSWSDAMNRLRRPLTQLVEQAGASLHSIHLVPMEIISDMLTVVELVGHV